MSLLPALLQAAEAEGFYMLTFTGPNQAQGQFDELLHSGSVDAFIFTDSTIDDPRAKFLAGRKFPFVCYGRLSPDLPQCWVDMDNNAATTLLVDHFLDNGAQTVAFVSPTRSAYWDKERAASFDRHMRQRAYKPIAISMRNTATDIQRTLDRLVDRPEPLALIVSSRSLATALLTAIRSRGLIVGTDIAVGVYDAPAIPWMDDPALATVSVDSKTSAAALLSRCLTEIRTGTTEQPGEYLSPQLHIGISA
jgi:DNA-binding LacI/PurR family transcriptional regulator